MREMKWLLGGQLSFKMYPETTHNFSSPSIPGIESEAFIDLRGFATGRAEPQTRVLTQRPESFRNFCSLISTYFFLGPAAPVDVFLPGTGV